MSPAPNNPEETLATVARRHAPGGHSELGYNVSGSWGCFVLGDDYDGSSSWAQGLSHPAGTTTVSVFVLEGAWSLNVFFEGRHITSYSSHDSNEPMWLGDLDQAAKLLDVERIVLEGYCVSPTADISLDDRDDEDQMEELYRRFEGYRAFMGDEFEPWDEWGFCDLIRKFGFEYPESESRVAVAATAQTELNRRDEWVGLSALLKPSDAVFVAQVPTIKPWWKFW